MLKYITNNFKNYKSNKYIIWTIIYIKYIKYNKIIYNSTNILILLFLHLILRNIINYNQK